MEAKDSRSRTFTRQARHGHINSQISQNLLMNALKTHATMLIDPRCWWKVLRVVDFDNQVLVAGFRSWFGGILCLDWSPDGRYIVAGGEVSPNNILVGLVFAEFYRIR